MAEDAAYSRHGYKGGAKETTVPSGFAAGASSLTGSDLSTWSGVQINGPFFFVVDDGLSTEEVCEATGLSGNVISGISRGLRGTSNVEHAANCKIKHVSTDRDFDEANALVNAILGISGLTAGDLLYLLTATSFGRLAKGTARQALIMNAGATAPSWGDSLASLLSAQGDLPYASAANTPARLAKGTANQALVMNAGATAPAWAASIQSLLTSTGDLLYASGANTPARLAVGLASQVLGGGTTPGWVPGLAGAQWAETTTSETTTSATYADLSTVGPAVTITVGASGRLLIWLGVDAYNSGAGNFSAASFALSGATTQAASDTFIVSAVAATTASGSDIGSLFILSGLTPGSTTVTAKYRVGAGTGTYTRRRILALPL